MSQFFSAAMVACDHRCVYCGKDLLIDFETFMTAEEDHLFPRALEGADDASNIVMSCSLCNRLKGKFIPEKVDPANRKDYLHAVREEILRRRLKHLELYFGWVFTANKDFAC